MSRGGYSYSTASGIGRLNLTEAVTYGTYLQGVFQHGTMLVTFGDETPGADQVDAGLGGLVRFGQSWLALQYFNYQHIVASGVDARLLSRHWRRGGGARPINLATVGTAIRMGSSHVVYSDRSDDNLTPRRGTNL